MFYHKGSLYPLLGDHPDIKKAWEAWDEIITIWDKTAKGEGSLSSLECLDNMFAINKVLPSHNRTLQLKNTISARHPSVQHGLFNLEKSLNFGSCVEKSLKST